MDPNRAAMRTAMINQACTAFAGQGASQIAHEDVVAMLIWLNQRRGFVLDVDGTAYQNVQFSPAEFGEILHEAASQRVRRQFQL